MHEVNWPSPLESQSKHHHHHSKLATQLFNFPSSMQDFRTKLTPEQHMDALTMAISSDPSSEEAERVIDYFLDEYSPGDKVRYVQREKVFSNLGAVRAIVKRCNKVGCNVKMLNLLTILSRNPGNLTYLPREGVIDLIFEAMRSNEQDAAIQTASCRALNNISTTNDNRDNILRVGGVSAVLQVLHTHADDEICIQEACRTLRNLTCDGPMVPSGLLIAHEGGINRLVEIVDRYLQHQAIVVVGVSALCNLSVDDANKKGLMECGGIQVILRAMKQHRNELRLQQDGCKFLGNLCVIASNKVRVADDGGLTAILNCLQLNIHHELIVEQACRTLCYMAAQPELMGRINDAGAVDLVISAIKRHPAVSRVHEYALWIITNLSSHDKVRELLCCDRVVDIVIWTMKSSLRDPRVQQEGCRFICLTAINDTSSRLIVDAGGVQALCASMRRHLTDLKTQQLALYALANLRTYTGVSMLALFKHEDGFALVASALRTFPSDPDLRRSVRRLRGSAWVGLLNMFEIESVGRGFLMMTFLMFFVAASLTFFRQLCSTTAKCEYPLTLEWEGVAWSLTALMALGLGLHYVAGKTRPKTTAAAKMKQ